MKHSKRAIQSDPRDALRHNPRIDKNVVRKHQALEKKLQKLGVDTQPRYSLSPPLGTSSSRLHHRARATGRS